MSAGLDLLLESSVRALAVALLIGAVLVVSRSRVSALRHAAWTFALGAMLLMPVLVRVTPELPAIVPMPAWPMLNGDFAADDIAADVPSAGTSGSTRTGVAAPAAAQSLPAGSTAGGPVSPSAGISFTQIVLVVWAAGVVVSLARLAAGLWWMRRLQEGATRLEGLGTDAPAYSSPAAAVPMTAGIFRPRILLPADWPAWPSARLAAVLAHEDAHARRRDALILFAAAINRSIFWFHPLAWWLTRTLAATAEEACDAAAVRAIGNARQYAQILVTIADEARRGHGRVAWAAVGIHGAQGIRQRIDRILSGAEDHRSSFTRTAGVLFACSLALLVVASCRQQQAAAIVLKEDPEIAERLARQRKATEFHKAATSMTVDEVSGLEASLEKNPEDLEVRRTLWHFYQSIGSKVLGWNQMIAARRRHLLWIIEHHPDHELAAWPRVSPASDPVGYADAKKAWLVKTAASDASTRVLSNAASFFETGDKAIAEQLLLRAKTIEPDGPTPRTANGVYYPSWTDRLGAVYALAIVGSNEHTLFNVVHATSPAEARSPFARKARKLLEESNDPELLLSVGRYLLRNAQNAKVEFDREALAISYLERAAKLRPNGTAQQILEHRQRNDAAIAERNALRAKEAELAGAEIAQKLRDRKTLTREEHNRLDEVEAQAVASLPEPERFRKLPELAATSYNSAEAVDYYDHDVTRAKFRWERSKAYAREALSLAPKYQATPDYGTAIYEANVVLSINALREGDVKMSVTYLKAAGKAPSLPAGREFGIENTLFNYLLKAGEKDSVAEFFEQSAAINPAQKERFLKDAADIRAGKMPMSFQYMVTPH